MKKLFKNHCTASLLTVITGFLVLVAVSVWGMGMYCLTSVTAEYAASRYLAGYGDFASTIAQRCFEPRLGKAGSSKYKNREKSLLWPPGWEPRWFRESEQRNWSFMTV